jgi:hypothetical protein
MVFVLTGVVVVGNLGNRLQHTAYDSQGGLFIVIILMQLLVMWITVGAATAGLIYIFKLKK